jgi:hypothetical protein
VLVAVVNMSNMQIPANSVWSSMNYTPPRGSCNHKNGMISNKCPCLRFMLHPVKVGLSFSLFITISLVRLPFCVHTNTRVSHRPLPHSSATAAATMLPITIWIIPLKTLSWQSGLPKRRSSQPSNNQPLHHETNASASPPNLTMTTIPQ